MEFDSDLEYLLDITAPLVFCLLAFDASGSGGYCGKIREIFGVSGPEGEYWESYAALERSLAVRLEERRASGLSEPCFERLCAAFRLEEFERFALTLALAREIDGRFIPALGLVSSDMPTMDFALRLYSAGPVEALHWRRRWLGRESLLALLYKDAPGGLDMPLSIRPCLLRFILGAHQNLDGTEFYLPGALNELPVPEHEFPDAALKILDASGERRIFILRGPNGAGKRHQMRRLSEKAEKPVLFAEQKAVLSAAGDILAALVATGAYLCVCGVTEERGLESVFGPALEYSGAIFITTERDGLEFRGHDIVTFEFQIPDTAGRRAIWASLLADQGHDPDIASVAAAKYAFTFGGIKTALEAAKSLMLRRGEAQLSPALLEEGCALCLPSSVSGLMKEIPAVFTWDELILPSDQKRTLLDACARMRYAGVVYEDWGFGKKLPYGRGVKILFSGPSGTGKTMAAQVMASEMKMRLYKVSLPALVSKYVGETEKNMALLFEDAQRSGAMLFIDEADALFGARTEQQDSHDRFANMQTAYLLQAVEDYEGVLIMATNLPQNMDPAFARRLQCRVSFTVPNAEERRGIWDGLLREGLPAGADIDIDFLAENFELTGAEIKNTVLGAAFLAAAEGKDVGMAEINRALFAEFSKIGKIVPELGQGWRRYFL